MDEVAALRMIKDHFAASNVSVAGGGPQRRHRPRLRDFADDAVLEWPQGGELVRGKANIIAFRSTYHARQEFQFPGSPTAMTSGSMSTPSIRRQARPGCRDHGVPRRQGSSRAHLLRGALGPADVADGFGRADGS